MTEKIDPTKITTKDEYESYVAKLTEEWESLEAELYELWINHKGDSQNEERKINR